MAKVWKKLQRSDADYTGNVTGTVDGKSASSLKADAIAGKSAHVVVDDAFDAGKLKVANAADALKNANTTATDVGLSNVANESPATLKSTMSLNLVENKSQSTILGGNLTGTIGGTANATVLSGAASGATIAPAFDTSGSSPVIKVANAPSTMINSNTTASDVGLGSVTNASQATIQAATLSAATKSDVGLSAVDNTADSAKPVSTAQATSIATKAPTANPTFTGTVAGVSSTHVGLGNVSNITTTAIREGVTKANVGLSNVIDQAVTVAGGKLKFGSSVQTMDADTIDGDSKATVKAAAVSTAETNIIGSAPGALNTLAELATSLGNNASFASSMTTSLAAKAQAPVTIANPATAPTEAVGVQGIHGDELYVVQDI